MAMSFMPMDGPSKWMASYLEKNKMLAPDDWRGIRDIDKKLEAPIIDFIQKDEDEMFDDEDQDVSADHGEGKSG